MTSLRILFIHCAFLSLSVSAATVVMKDGTRYQGEILQTTDSSLTLKVKMGAIAADMSLTRSDIAEVRDANVAVAPDKVELKARQLEEKALAAVRNNDPRSAAAAWASIALHYEGNVGYSKLARSAWENAAFYDETNSEVQGWRQREEERTRVAAKAREDAALAESTVKSLTRPYGYHSDVTGSDFFELMERTRPQPAAVQNTPYTVQPSQYTVQYSQYTMQPAAQREYDSQRSHRHRDNCAPSRHTFFLVSGVTTPGRPGSRPPSSPPGYTTPPPSYTPPPPTNCPGQPPPPSRPTPPPPTYSTPPTVSRPPTRPVSNDPRVPPVSVSNPPIRPAGTPPSSPGGNPPRPPSGNPGQPPSLNPPRPPSGNTPPTNGNNGLGNGIDPQPPGNPPVNDGAGTRPGNPGNRPGSTARRPK